MRAGIEVWIAAVLCGCSDSIAPSHVDSVRFVTVAGGGDHTCALSAGGAAYCWGNNLSGAVGVQGKDPIISVPEPVVIGPLRLRALDAGFQFSCGLLTTGRSLCWGNGGSAPRQFLPDLQLNAVSLGDFGCALGSDSLTTCWQDPDGEPYQVMASHFRMLSVGGLACGLTASGSAECWGPGETTATPVSGGFTFSTVSAGGQHACGILDTGVLACWGDNTDGQLGDFSLNSRSTPAPVGSSQGFLAVAAGKFHTCGIGQDSLAYCWGSALSGRLGYGGFPPSYGGHISGPTKVRGGDLPTTLKWIAITAGDRHSCGVGTDEHIYCWGANDAGQVGDGSTEVRPEPSLTGGGDD